MSLSKINQSLLIYDSDLNHFYEFILFLFLFFWKSRVASWALQSELGMQWQSPASLISDNKKDGYRQQNVRQRQKLISIIDMTSVWLSISPPL